MTSRTLLLALACSVCVALPAADAQVAFSIAGGAVGPAGNLGQTTDIGYNVGVAANFGRASNPIGVRVEAAHNAFTITTGGEKTFQNITGNVVFNLRPLPDSPYLIAGAGAYRYRGSSTVGTATFSTGRTSTGFNGGAGLRFPLVGLSTFLEVRYHYMSPASNGGQSSQFVPLTFGIVF